MNLLIQAKGKRIKRIQKTAYPFKQLYLIINTKQKRGINPLNGLKLQQGSENYPLNQTKY